MLSLLFGGAVAAPATLLGVLLLQALIQQGPVAGSQLHSKVQVLVAAVNAAALFTALLNISREDVYIQAPHQTSGMAMYMLLESLATLPLVLLYSMQYSMTGFQVVMMMCCELVQSVLKFTCASLAHHPAEWPVVAVTFVIAAIMAMKRCALLDRRAFFNRRAMKPTSQDSRTTPNAVQACFMSAQIAHGTLSPTFLIRMLGWSHALGTTAMFGLELSGLLARCGYAWTIMLIIQQEQQLQKMQRPQQANPTLRLQHQQQLDQLHTSPSSLPAEQRKSQPAASPTLQAYLQNKQQLITEISHDMRTPLGPIIALTDAMIQGSCGDLSENVLQTLTIINASGRRLLFYMSDVMTALEFSTKGQPECCFSGIRLWDIVEEAAKLYKPLAMKGVSIDTMSPNHLPVMHGNSEKLLQALYTIVSTSCRLGPKGNASIKLLMSIPDHVAICVGRGEGLNAEDLVLNTAGTLQIRGASGTKEELSFSVQVAKQIIKAHGGQLLVHSVPKVTQQYVVLLPLDPESVIKKQRLSNTSDNLYNNGPFDLVPPASPHVFEGGTQDSQGTRIPEKSANPNRSGAQPEDLKRNARGAQRIQSITLKRAIVEDAQASPSSHYGLARGDSIQPRRAAANISLKAASNKPNLEADSTEHMLGSNADSLAEQMKSTHSERFKVTQVLSVDDDPTNQMVIQAMLEPLGMNVVQAMDGQEALAVLEGSELLPDLILLDVMMPNVSGYEVCRKFRAQYASSFVPIIMVSAKTQEEDIVQGLLAGASDYVTKPFKHTEILARIKSHLQASRSIRDQISETKPSTGSKTTQGIQHAASPVVVDATRNPVLPSSIIQKLQQSSEEPEILQSLDNLALVAIRMDGVREVLDMCTTEQLDSVISILAVFLQSIQMQAAKHRMHCVGPWEGTSMLFVAGMEGDNFETAANAAMAFGIDALELSQQHRLPYQRPFNTSVCISGGETVAVVSGFDYPTLHLVGPALSVVSRLMVACPRNSILTSFKPRKHDVISLQLAAGPSEAYLLEVGDWQSGIGRAEESSKAFAKRGEGQTLFNFAASLASPLHVALQMVTSLRSMMIWDALSPAEAGDKPGDAAPIHQTGQSQTQSLWLKSEADAKAKEAVRTSKIAVEQSKKNASKNSDSAATKSAGQTAGIIASSVEPSDVHQNRDDAGTSDITSLAVAEIAANLSPQCSLVSDASLTKHPTTPTSGIDVFTNPTYGPVSISNGTTPPDTRIQHSPLQPPYSYKESQHQQPDNQQGEYMQGLPIGSMPTEATAGHQDSSRLNTLGSYDVKIGAYRGSDAARGGGHAASMGFDSPQWQATPPRASLEYSSPLARNIDCTGQTPYGMPPALLGASEYELKHRYMNGSPGLTHGQMLDSRQTWSEQMSGQETKASHRGLAKELGFCPRRMSPNQTFREHATAAPYPEAPALLRVLREAGVEHLAGRFMEQELTVVLLSALSDPELREMGLETLGSRLKLRLALQHAT